MTRIITGLFSILLLSLLTNCQVDTKSSATGSSLSPLIDYQYLLKTNDKLGYPIKTYKIRYDSDGHEITGFITIPENGKKNPIIVYNRAGYNDAGVFDMDGLRFLESLAAKGFVAMTSQLRGNIFSEGKDEMGGKDVNDILKLIKIAKSGSFGDSDNIGVMGNGRGALNAYQVSRKSDDIKAILVISGVVDPRLEFERNPAMKNLYEGIVGDVATNKAAYDDRSPILWANEINEPVLLLHGNNDPLISIQSAQKMVDKMKSLNKKFEHHFFEGDDETLNANRGLRDDFIKAWFDKYLRPKS